MSLHLGLLGLAGTMMDGGSWRLQEVLEGRPGGWMGRLEGGVDGRETGMPYLGSTGAGAPPWAPECTSNGSDSWLSSLMP